MKFNRRDKPNHSKMDIPSEFPIFNTVYIGDDKHTQLHLT
jgi:hypothetical protein